MINKIFKNGMTVKDLKDAIKDWPEVDDNGDQLEVWLGKDGLSNQCVEITPLNVYNGKGDILLDL